MMKRICGAEKNKEMQGLQRGRAGRAVVIRHEQTIVVGDAIWARNNAPRRMAESRQQVILRRYIRGVHRDKPPGSNTFRRGILPAREGVEIHRRRLEDAREARLPVRRFLQTVALPEELSTGAATAVAVRPAHLEKSLVGRGA